MVVVHCAGIQDRDGAQLVLTQLQGVFPRLQRIWADQGYAGALVTWAAALAGWVLEIVQRPADATGFVVLPKRWIVERTLAWLSRYKRLSKDYEETSRSSEAWVQLAMIHLMTRRLAPGA